VMTDIVEEINMNNQFLENERIALEEKITEARNKGNENTYKNLIQAYERILELIRKENMWEDMYSHYYDGETPIKGENEYVATWKQRDNGDIKDHKIYKIEKEVTPKPTYDLYFDVERRDGGNCKCRIYFKDEVNGVVGDFKFIAKYISDLCFNEKVNIYGDTFGLGLGLADQLKVLGYTVKPTIINTVDITRNIFNKEIKQDYGKLR
jgi:hypothetical protein